MHACVFVLTDIHNEYVCLCVVVYEYACAHEEMCLYV